MWPTYISVFIWCIHYAYLFMVACRHAMFLSVAFSFIWWIEKLTMCLLFANVTCSTETNQQRGFTELLEATELLMFQILHITKTLRPKQNGRHFADDIFKCIFLNGDIWIPNNISLKLVPKGPGLSWVRSSLQPAVKVYAIVSGEPWISLKYI